MRIYSVGREADAQRVIEEVKSLPKMKNMYGTDFDPAISALVALLSGLCSGVAPLDGGRKPAATLTSRFGRQVDHI